ncbi:MAG: elongation factor G [Ruminococcaceae bacterium]|nr:elongation factor G [Oscillospiraceae bacterium]
MKQFNAGKIRNIALAGHSDSGKTSLAEAMLFAAGATDRLGKTADGNTVCDFDPEEIKRAVTVSTAAAPLVWNDTKINLLDTPGLFDFAAGFYEGVRAAETTLITVSARSGVSVGTEKAFDLATANNKMKAFFITKLDTENADFYKVLGQLRETFGSSVCPLIIPYLEGDKVACYINLAENKAYAYAGGKSKEVAVPAGAADIIEESIMTLSEAIAETDEELMLKFFDGEQFTKEEIEKGIQLGITTGALAPVFCGSPTSMEGVDIFMNAIVSIVPPSSEAICEKAVDADDKEVEIKCDENAPLASYVFKTVADPFVGKLSFFKVISGKLSADITPVNARTGQTERLGKLVFVKGKKQEDADYIGAGDIGAVTKLAEAVTGDSYCDAKRVVKFAKVEYPTPCLTMAVTPKGKGDEGKIAQGLQRLMEEDPTITFELNPETHQQLLSGLGEQHLDVITSKLKAKFGAEIALIKPRFAYRETIRKKVKVQGKHKKQSGGHGQYGDVWIEFEPTDSLDLVFEESVFGGSVPRNFFPAVEKGLRDAVKTGTMAGYPMVGVLARLVDGSYHPVDSNDMSFQMAAKLAFKAGIPQASPALLEPIGTLKVLIPDSNTGDIMGDLNKRRGRVLGMTPTGKLTEIEAEVPMSEMHDFSTTLRSVTQGRGSYTLTFERYEQLPQMLEATVIEEAKSMREEE